MSKTWLATISTIALMTVSPAVAHAKDISAKKVSIKDNANPAKRQVAVQSNDAGVLLTEGDDPGANGASLHVYSATDDFCAILPSGPSWKHTSSQWKYANKATKTSAHVGDGKLVVKTKSGVTYTLADNGTQGTVNAQVQFGSGTRYCMRCSAAKKDNAKKFLAKGCAAAACDPEPSVCDPFSTTTTTTSTTTTSTTCPPSTHQVLKGSLTATLGRFNYNLTLGLPGANSACNMNFPGTHACTYPDLQAAAAACDLAGLMDTASIPVTSFWAIDSSQPPLQQCNDDAMGGSGLNWEYGTAHTASRGERVTLDNASGALGSLQTGVQCNIAGTSSVGCCQ
ncbi:MAG: hypothetical protein E6J71_26500 [Deltaproteobacteria bacterium]|nr:MAG: hypothetical protein E6J71_26500 [Deltaproteobacteria bacterium]